MLGELSRRIEGSDGKEQQACCFAHVINLVAKGVLHPLNLKPTCGEAVVNEDEEAALYHLNRQNDENKGKDRDIEQLEDFVDIDNLLNDMDLKDVE